MSLLAPARRSYRPGDRGERNPITADQIALAVEYRSLGLSWACCGTLLRVNTTRLRIAVGATIGRTPTGSTSEGRSSVLGRSGATLRGIPVADLAPPLAADGRRGRDE